MPDPLMDTLDEIDRKSGTFLHVIFGYRNLGKPLKILKFSWVSSPSHLVLCYIVLPLFMNPHKGKNKGRNQLRKHCF